MKPTRLESLYVQTSRTTHRLKKAIECDIKIPTETLNLAVLYDELFREEMSKYDDDTKPFSPREQQFVTIFLECLSPLLFSIVCRNIDEYNS